MQPFRVYDGESNNVATKVFGGKASGIRDWDNIKYPVMHKFNKDLFGEYWIEDEVKLAKDIEEYREKLNDSERYVYNVLSGYLNWLDCIATDFNFVLAYLCSDPSVRSVIAMINSFEQLHNRSYQYLTATVLNQREKEEAFEGTRRDEDLVARNNIVIEPIQGLVDIVQEYWKSDTPEGEELPPHVLQAIFKAILGNMVLEGLYFTGGFAFFHSLARDNKMLGSNNLISMIRTDENMHSTFYGMLLQIVMLENPSLNTDENYQYMVEYIKKAVLAEQAWAAKLFAGIDTLSIKEYQDYVEHLANLICRNAGIEELYPDNTELKSRWIATYGAKKRAGTANEVVTRIDFLQGNAINYAHEGGEDFDL